jgi:hypothetical protein
MGKRHARNIVRGLVSIALLASLLGSSLTPAPEDLPAVALGQGGLYRLEIALVVFYGFLLLITPAFSGLGRGRLPTEISVRGAKFAEGTEESVDRNEANLRRLERAISSLSEAQATTNAEIERLKTRHNRG